MILKNPYVSVTTSGPTTVDLSAYVQQISGGPEFDEVDTTVGNAAGTKSSEAGMESGSLEVTCLQAFGTGTPDAVNAAAYEDARNGLNVTVEFRAVNASRSATNPGWSAAYKCFVYKPVDTQVGQAITTVLRFVKQGALSKLTS
ncbi:MAG TPA: hypothetical protein VF746_13365 [Longimicrobium sp.]|jgi:hypothetical protein